MPTAGTDPLQTFVELDNEVRGSGPLMKETSVLSRCLSPQDVGELPVCR